MSTLYSVSWNILFVVKYWMTSSCCTCFLHSVQNWDLLWCHFRWTRIYDKKYACSTVRNTWNWTKNVNPSKTAKQTFHGQLSASRNLRDTLSSVDSTWLQRHRGMLDLQFIIEWHARCSARGISCEICLEWHLRGNVHFYVLCTVYGVAAKYTYFYGFSPDVHNLLEVTSNIILKLDGA